MLLLDSMAPSMSSRLVEVGKDDELMERGQV